MLLAILIEKLSPFSTIDRGGDDDLYAVINNHVEGTYDKLESGDTSALEFDDDLKAVTKEAPRGSFIAKIVAAACLTILLVCGGVIVVDLDESGSAFGSGMPSCV